ncbi:conserved exported protein of unknown function [Nitratireductor aquimarinus]|uniref:hypothetical protein n=1 Tax=Nitratireductor aquimarinus TaxID=889300 RepID=UPI003B5AD26D
MKKIAGIGLLICASALALAFYVWAQPAQIKHYTADELMGFNCEELGTAHEDLIVAYHDAEIARHRREGSFSDDLGLPKEDDLPFVVLMRRFMQDNDIREADLAKPSSPSATLQRSSFYAEISGLCAGNPSLGAVEAMRQAATKLNLID